MAENKDLKSASSKDRNVVIGIILVIIGLLLLLYAGVIALAPRFEASITFPGVYIAKPNFDLPNGFEEINIDDGNGNNINGVYAKGIKEETVYYFHGNGGPIDYFYDELEYINSLGYSVMAYDYPGFGKSEGFPFKEDVSNFSNKFYSHLNELKGVDSNKLIIWGYSVGTAVAVDFSLQNNFDKLILISPFTSTKDMAKHFFPLPLHEILFLDDSYPTKDSIKDINVPLLIIHGNKDNIVPFDHSKELYSLANTEKYFIELDNFGHNYIISTYGDSLKGIINNFIAGKDVEFVEPLFLDSAEKERLEFENNVDLFTDSSLQKFVSANISFNNIAYVPSDLVKISSEYIYDTKGGTQTLREDAKMALDALGKRFYDDFGRKLNIVSAYRSYEYQRGIRNSGCPDNFCAKAGYSEHQTGLVVDIFEASSDASWRGNPTLFKYYVWFTQNAHLYGYHNTYQKGLAIDTYEIEPWHWRYLGVELATYLYENDLTIAEYYKIKTEESNKG